MSDGALPCEIDVQQVKRLLETDAEVLLLDCRDYDEWQRVRIPGARWIPLGELPIRLAELEGWKDRRIVVYCHHGMRSLQAVYWLRKRGFSRAQSMQGGIDAWSCLVDPQLPRYV